MTRPRGYASSPCGSSGTDKFSRSTTVSSRYSLQRFLATNAASVTPMSVKNSPSPGPRP
jgi:hypothetical protein